MLLWGEMSLSLFHFCYTSYLEKKGLRRKKVFCAAILVSSLHSVSDQEVRTFSSLPTSNPWWQGNTVERPWLQSLVLQLRLKVHF